MPNNLFPFIAQVAIGKRDQLTIWGNDWPTPDGTGVRDYLHVIDLARGHVAALEYAFAHAGYSDHQSRHRAAAPACLQMVRRLKARPQRKIPYVFGPRRAGDIAACWADASLAQRLLGWRGRALGIEQACADGWRWQQQNPERIPQLTCASGKHRSRQLLCAS